MATTEATPASIPGQQDVGCRAGRDRAAAAYAPVNARPAICVTTITPESEVRRVQVPPTQSDVPQARLAVSASATASTPDPSLQPAAMKPTPRSAVPTPNCWARDRRSLRKTYARMTVKMGKTELSTETMLR